jgi:hypothetical protein
LIRNQLVASSNLAVGLVLAGFSAFLTSFQYYLYFTLFEREPNLDPARPFIFNFFKKLSKSRHSRHAVTSSLKINLFLFLIKSRHRRHP